MAAFGDRIQTLMDEVYNEWQKEENRNKGKWDILEGFSEAHQIAVVFGNFNNQVENGGIEQWIYNGYFHEDAEKLSELLETGAELDERCRTILDRIYKLDQYAQETECDRYGSFHDEDGESGFIGDMMNCDAFNTWYYEHCGKDDWWETVCGIIDKAETLETAPARQDEIKGENAAPSPIQVYIENATDSNIGGFTIPLPTTRKALAPWFAAVEADSNDPGGIRIVETRSSITLLGRALRQTDYSLDEINYLAAKIKELDDGKMDVFLAALESGRYGGDIGSVINLTENLDCLYLQPAFSEEQYGDFLLDSAKDNTSEAFERLEKSENEAERDLTAHILNLEAYIDKAAYGRDMAKQENGVFTQYGYLTEAEGFVSKYHGLDDIPKEYRIFPREEPLLKTADIDLAPFMVKLHALAGDYSRDAAHNLETLARLRSADYLLLLDGKSAYLTETMHAYRRGTTAFDVWMSASGDKETEAFAVHLTEVHSRLAGDVYQIDVTEWQKDILNHSVQPIRIDATFKNGEAQSYSPDEWNVLSAIEKDRVQEYNRVFKDEDYTNIRRHIESTQVEYESAGKPVGEDAFLTQLNSAYMDQARYPMDSFLRITQDAAKEMLARGDADVYRLLPDGAEKLAQIDAVKSGLWFSEFREFVVRREDMPKLDNWAERSAGKILRQSQERGEHKQSHEPEM